MNRIEVAKVLDYAVLKPTNTYRDIEEACKQVLENHIGTLCVLPPFVKKSAELLKGGKSKVCAVIAFPFGASLTEVKIREAELAVSHGAEEVDFVINIPLFKSGAYEAVERDVEEVTEAAKRAGEARGVNVVVKVIIETGYLTPEEIVSASKLVEEAGADFVKTCTGFGPRGATLEDVRLITSTVKKAKVKAAGGISSYSRAIEFLRAGASRIGTSHALQILSEDPT
ncbi:MAG: deoxyribose-phosphate aldolase [Thermofilaceae archaeon]